jgi:predicted negative regulator of RcsB-dependent stress response
LPDPEVGAHLGEVLWKQGDKAAATKVWNTALETNPANPVLTETMQRFIP